MAPYKFQAHPMLSKDGIRLFKNSKAANFVPGVIYIMKNVPTSYFILNGSIYYSRIIPKSDNPEAFRINRKSEFMACCPLDYKLRLCYNMMTTKLMIYSTWHKYS